MKSIIRWFGGHLASSLPLSESDLVSLSHGKGRKLWLKPEAFLQAINGQVVATWALAMAAHIRRPQLPRGPGGRPATYSDMNILLMAVVQTAWRLSYADIVDMVRADESLVLAMDFPQRTPDGQVQTVSQGQYWERRAALGLLSLLFFFLGLVTQLIRLGVVVGSELIVDSTRLQAWRHADPGAAWSRYVGQAALLGYKVHTVLCRHADLPVFVVITPANVHDSLVGFIILLAAVLAYGFRVAVVYADAAYFDGRMLGLIHDILGASPAVDYNLRCQGKKKLATFFFLGQWRRYVLGPRSAIERHFAWVKRYFGLKYFQCYTFVRVAQFVLLTYIVVVAVALAAQRYQRPDLVRSRCAVLAHADHERVSERSLLIVYYVFAGLSSLVRSRHSATIERHW